MSICLIHLILLPLWGYIFFVTLDNFWKAFRFRPCRGLFPLDQSVSVLIPARNEENHLPTLLEHLLAQDHPIHEIIVYNDQSTDRTGKIVASYAARYNHIHLVPGDKLPPGWLGKNHACHQLSQRATGELLLFVDADVRLEPWVARSALCLIKKHRLTMLSVFPRQITKSLGEKLTVPLMNWLLLSFLPLHRIYNSWRKAYVAANGQFMLWDARVYRLLGGHKRVKDFPVEDMALAKLLRQKRYRMMTLLGEYGIFCRMYTSFSEAWQGYSKNFYYGFGLNAPLFVLFSFFLAALFLHPVLLLFWHTSFWPWLIVALLQRWLMSLTTQGQPLWEMALHLFQGPIFLLLGLHSLWRSKTQQLYWKGRKL